MASISKITGKDGKTAFRAQVLLKDGKKRYKTFHRKTDAKAWASNLEFDIRERPYLNSSEASRRTFKEAVERYTAEEIPNLSKNTSGGYIVALDWWMDFFGEITLKDITPALISDGVSALRKRMTVKIDERTAERKEVPVSPATVKRYIAALSAVLTKCQQKWHWISINAARAVEKPKVNNERTRYLNDQPEKSKGSQDKDSELARLLKAVAESTSRDLELAVNLAIHTGGRKEEVLGIKWDEIDLKNGVVFFTKTKNKEQRAVTIPNHIVEMLKKRKRYHQRIDTPLVFPNNPKPGNSIKSIDLKKSWRNARDKAQVYDFRWHDLRHTHASFLAMEGASLLEIAAVLGQKTLQMTKRYSHLSPEHIQKTSTLVAARLSRQNQGN